MKQTLSQAIGVVMTNPLHPDNIKFEKLPKHSFKGNDCRFYDVRRHKCTLFLKHDCEYCTKRASRENINR